MSIHSCILPDEKVFADFRQQCLSSDNWVNKYDNSGMQVWVEVPAKKGKQGPKVHKIKVSPSKHSPFLNTCRSDRPCLTPSCVSLCVCVSVYNANHRRVGRHHVRRPSRQQVPQGVGPRHVGEL